MAKLYVANCSRQYQEVHYRLDYNEAGRQDQNSRFQPAKRMTIPPGRQVVLGGDMHIKQIEDVIDQLSKYGMVGVVDVPRLKTVAPLVFNIELAVPAEIIRKVQQINAGVMIEQGKVRRQKAAIAVDDIVQRTVNNQFAEANVPADTSRDTVETSVEQLEQSEAGEKTIAEGFRVDPNAPKGATRGKGSRRKN